MDSIAIDKQKKQSKGLSLAQKLSMLVALPLVIGFVFVGTLAMLLRIAQMDARQIEKAKETQTLNSEILHSTYKMVSMGFIFAMKGDSSALQTYELSKQDVGPELKKLRAICAKDPAAKRSADIVTVLMLRLVDCLDDLTRPNKLSYDEYCRLAGQSQFLSKMLVNECLKIAEIQRHIHTHPTSNANWQMRIYFALAVGIVLSLIISGLALRYVQLDLLQRIALMMRNTASIARREPLKEQVSGSDELAELDKFIHAADDSIRQLEQSRQEFISMLTHDMRSPLTQIQFSVSVLAEGTYEDNPEKRQKMLQTLVPEISRLNRLIDDLLTANKLESEPLKLLLEPLSAADLLKQVSEVMEMEASSRQRTVKVNAVESKVLADSFQIIRVLTNLCANALKYTPPGATVELCCQAQGESVLFEVIDDGPGISAELAEHLFERYSQGKDSQTRTGFGLGLYIAKSIVLAHGGQIGYLNRSQKDGQSGSVFYFTLKKAELS
ncbi:MAG: HAMP domain-containing histidine kinase [Candidatus Obscuribacterales bacterium]|nr:HAMP domain-containing histidine kinase [Candidatus Obscuribacterales bacterium]